MAMQTLQQELDPAEHPVHSHPVLRELMADPVTAYAEEVRVLRQRVAMLESELAATKAAQLEPSSTAPALASIEVAAAANAQAKATSEFTECSTPAVVSVDFAPAAAQRDANAQAAASCTEPPAQHPVSEQETDAAPSTEPVPNPGFAQAWTAEDAHASFEERIAERAFFQATTVDEESRSWLLTD